MIIWFISKTLKILTDLSFHLLLCFDTRVLIRLLPVVPSFDYRVVNKFANLFIADEGLFGAVTSLWDIGLGVHVMKPSE